MGIGIPYNSSIPSLSLQLNDGQDPPHSLFGDLWWREFCFLIVGENQNYDRIKNNPLCIPITWQKSVSVYSTIGP